MGERFLDRAAAGRELARHLDRYAGGEKVIVLGLPRGGVPVAYEVAAALGVPLDVFVVRKLGTPGHKELAMGAIASGGARYVSREVVSAAAVEESEIEVVARREAAELERRERSYRGDREPAAVTGRTAILVDDGLATGSTMRAAVAALRERGAGRIVVAVPVAPPATCDALRDEVEEAVCARTPEPFMAVGHWYEDFEQTTDAEVRELLDRAGEERPTAPARSGSGGA